jgi:hypothetical protein
MNSHQKETSWGCVFLIILIIMAVIVFAPEQETTSQQITTCKYHWLTDTIRCD